MPEPVCPRHPDRVAYVRCQRCGRPACPECQRTAAVGVHCVDCVREAARTAPQPRSVLGAVLRPGPPVVTLTLIALCVVSFVLQILLGSSLGRGSWTRALVFAPVLGDAEPWRFLTSAFLHDASAFPRFPYFLLHIGFNMYALWVVGQTLEAALGRWRFLALYLLSAVGGSVMVLVLAQPDAASWGTGVVGASGAVFGLFGAMLVVLRRLRRSAGPILAILAFNGILGFVLPGISWQAHLGGLVVGAALGAAFAWAPRTRRREVSVTAVAGVAVLLVAVAVARYALAG